LKFPQFYQKNKELTVDKFYYSNDIIYSPNVMIFKDEYGNELDEVSFVNVITSPAINKSAIENYGAREYNGSLDENKIDDVMKNRIRKILKVAILNNKDSIILGAWGCGVFGHSPVKVCGYFNEIIENELGKYFKNIIFAIYDESILQMKYKTFKHWFSKYENLS
jgi:uncharacterized protein (TIGR02452 family)